MRWHCIETEDCCICLQEDRLRGRGTETEESLTKRLAVAKAELDYGRFVSYDLCFQVLSMLYCFGIMNM